jgi:hypothetical protein
VSHEHVQRVNGRWLTPANDLGAWSVRRIADGSLQVIWACWTCTYRTLSVPHLIVSELGIDIRKLPISEDYAGLYGRCIVKGCTSDEVQLNHFGPQAIFGEEADNWPTGYLCVTHHREWGERVTPHLNPARRGVA